MRHSDEPLGANGKSCALLPLAEWGHTGESRSAEHLYIGALRIARLKVILASCPYAISEISYQLHSDSLFRKACCICPIRVLPLLHILMEIPPHTQTQQKSKGNTNCQPDQEGPLCTISLAERHIDCKWPKNHESMGKH
jgi:hypothetical protein